METKIQGLYCFTLSTGFYELSQWNKLDQQFNVCSLTAFLLKLFRQIVVKQRQQKPPLVVSYTGFYQSDQLVLHFTQIVRR